MDLADANSITTLIKEEVPDYLINLAGSTYVPESFASPSHVLMVNSVALVYILEAVRQFAPHCRVFSAGSSTEAEGKSIYAVSKIAANALCKVYRERYGLYVVHGIMHNHSSIRQPESFLPMKVSKGVARIAKAIKEGKSFDPLELGNLDSQIDLSWSADFVDGIWKMMNQEIYADPDWGQLPQTWTGIGLSNRTWFPKNYTLCSGELRTVRELVEKAFDAAKIDTTWPEQDPCKHRWWIGEGVDETYVALLVKGYRGIGGHGHLLVKINPAFYRPLDVISAPCDSSAARRELGWEPKRSFDQIIQEMVAADMAALD